MKVRMSTTSGVSSAQEHDELPGVSPESLVVKTLEPRRGFSSLGVRESLTRVDLLAMLIRRELKLRYTQTLLGPLWVIVNPLVPALLFTFVFTRVVRIETTGISYLLLVTTAMAPWTLFSRSLTRGGGSLIAERHLLTKVYFPRLLIPLAMVLASIVDLVVSVVIAMCTYHSSGGRVTLRLLALPAVAAWALAVSFAFTIFFAGLSVRRRDLVNALPFLLQVWLYLSPVAYPLTAVPIHLRSVIHINPLTSVVQGFQWCLTGRTTMPIIDLATGIALTGASLAIGLVVFSIGQRAVADVL